MDTKKFITGTLVGGITFFILGFLIYAVLLEGFFAANAGSATGVDKTEHMVWWSLVLGNLSAAALLSYIFLKWAHISTFKSGLSAGAVIGLFINLSWDMTMFATSNLMSLTGALVDVVAWTIAFAIAGGVIGAVLHAKPHPEAAVA
ncbi:MAG: hypothetical protein DHS20C17_32830 [Cyclobacteriaceae bacterium]|nr:MAG: hypothetical protein DHS20C17_32830 [Cyclobacteriaceae bacterium]